MSINDKVKDYLKSYRKTIEDKWFRMISRKSKNHWSFFILVKDKYWNSEKILAVLIYNEWRSPLSFNRLTKKIVNFSVLKILGKHISLNYIPKNILFVVVYSIVFNNWLEKHNECWLLLDFICTHFNLRSYNNLWYFQTL